LRHGPFRQDAITGRDLSSADTGVDRVALRHCALPDRTGIASTARLLLDDEVLRTGEVNTLASPPEELAGFKFCRRRKEPDT